MITVNLSAYLLTCPGHVEKRIQIFSGLGAGLALPAPLDGCSQLVYFH
jgi:hypothetical protein